MFATLDDIGEDVKVIREILTGNGNPDKGVVVRLVKVEQNQENFKEDMQEIKADLKAIHNRKSKSTGKFLGIIPVRALEFSWMLVVRSVITGVLVAAGWVGCNTDKIEKFFELTK